MLMTIGEFAKEASAILRTDGGPSGRAKVCELLKKVLSDKEFVEKYIPESTTERELLYEDPVLKFCIFAEHKSGAKTGAPHDLGPSWAIYGQAAGVTEMAEWEIVENAKDGKVGKIRKVKSYPMNPGSAFVFNEGVMHSPSRTGPTRLVRFEGMNLDALRAARPKFEVVT